MSAEYYRNWLRNHINRHHSFEKLIKDAEKIEARARLYSDAPVKRNLLALFLSKLPKFNKYAINPVAKNSPKRGGVGSFTYVFGPVFGFSLYLSNKQKKNLGGIAAAQKVEPVNEGF